MSPGSSAPQSFSWGETYAYQTDMRARVLAERTSWFIKIRWVMVALCAVTTVAAALRLLPAPIDWRVFAGTAAFLLAVNVIYRCATSWFPRKRRLMVAQVLTDYAALSALSYATGSIETPVPMLYGAHIILTALFFSRRTSLLLTCLGFAFALAPVLLEQAGVLPVVSVLAGPFKATVVARPPALAIYAAILLGCYLFLWYLTSTITASLKLRERQLEQSHGLLERLDQEKTQATLRATHELKAPFAAIKSYVYSLRDGYCGELPPKALEVVNRIGARCDRLTVMITTIIHVGNLRTAVVNDEDFTTVDLAQFLVPEIEDATVLGARRQVTVATDIPKNPRFEVRASARHLHTLVSNLLRNAVDYSHDGGTITVSLRLEERAVVLQVRDHGIGIARASLPKIFDDFFRSNEAARVNPHGNGLGLALVKEVAKLHGATIEVASEEGRGTCFWVRFPRTTPATQGGTNGQGTSHR